MEETYYYYNLKDLYNVSKSAVVDSKLPIWSTIYTKIMTNQNNQFKMYTNFDNSDMEQKLLQPLINRWASDNCYLLVTTQAPTQAIPSIIGAFTIVEANALLSRVWFKLDSILPKYKEEYKRLKVILDKDSFKTSSNSSNKAIVKQNDTPTSYGDYKADNYMSNYSETSNENENSVETNEVETYDAVVSRLRNLPQEIIDEMKEFEIWI